MIFYELMKVFNKNQIVQAMQYDEVIVCDDAWKVKHFSRALAVCDVLHVYPIERRGNIIMVVEVDINE